jgi:hypothetical protein
MHQMWWDANFTRQLDAPRLGYWWDALLLSAGGNDMIHACLVAPDVANPAQRLLLGPDEVSEPAAPEAYVSPGGWRAFETYLRAYFSDLVLRRNKGVNPQAAQAASTGLSNDFENEIHLTPAGYRKVGKAFAAFIEATL